MKYHQLNNNLKKHQSAAICGMAGAYIIAATLTAVLFGSATYADNTVTANASVTVTASCTMSAAAGTGGNATADGYSYSATIAPGTRSEIDGSVITVSCNTPGDYSLYAIGYSGDSYDTPTNTQMISSLGSNNIATGTAASGNTSNWAFKLSSVSGTSTPSIVSPYSGYSNIPSDFTKIAYAPGTTGTAATTAVQPKYQVYVSSAQAAATYTGKVKYTMVHPNDAAAPELPTYMQNVGTWGSSLNAGDEVVAIDARDGKAYYVTKLSNGEIWMAQNLDHDISSSYNYNSSNTDISNSPTLTSTHATSDTTWGYAWDTPESYDPGDLCWNGTIRNDWSGNLDNSTVSCSMPNHYHVGNYYNWTAAIAMEDSSMYDMYEEGGTDANQSICPAGWRLPTYSSYTNLVNTLSLTAGTSGNIQNTPVYFVYGGSWIGNSYDVGSIGSYWSSVAIDFHYGSYNFYFDKSGGLYPQNFEGDRGEGRSVRCVARL